MREKPTYKELLNQVALLQSRVSELEDLLKKNQEKTERLKSRFLTTVSHELRTPMNAILGFSNLMIDRNLSSDKKEEYMEHISNNSINLLTIVDAMIDVSLLEIDELKIKKEEVNLHNILQQVYYYFNIDKHKVGKDHIVLLYNKELKAEDFLIYTDGYRLNQVISGLLHNALKFTSKGIIEFGYKLREDQRKLHFFVKDSGKGILFEKAQSIFDKFEKIESEKTKNESGIGLGLTLAKGLVELLGGEIWLETNSFGGTTFHFTIDYLKGDKSVDQNKLNVYKVFV